MQNNTSSHPQHHFEQRTMLNQETTAGYAKGQEGSARESGNKALHLFGLPPKVYLCIVLFNCLWLQAIVCQVSECLNETSACLHILNTLSKTSTIVGCFCVVKKISKYLFCMLVAKDFKLKPGLPLQMAFEQSSGIVSFRGKGGGVNKMLFGW